MLFLKSEAGQGGIVFVFAVAVIVLFVIFVLPVLVAPVLAAAEGLCKVGGC